MKAICCHNRAVQERGSRRRRYPEAVVGSAVVVGLASSLPVAALILLGIFIDQSMAEGNSFAAALNAFRMTDEDWEMVPLAAIGALVISALIAVASGAAWLVLSARVPTRPWVARSAAAVAAAAVPPLLLAWDASWKVVAPAAVAAGVIALVFAPRVGFERPRRNPTLV